MIMQEALDSLLEFFGLSVAPTNLGEFIPYFFKGMFGIAFFVLIFNILRYWGGFGKNL